MAASLSAPNMASCGDSVDELDKAVGVILDALKKRRLGKPHPDGVLRQDPGPKARFPDPPRTDFLLLRRRFVAVCRAWLSHRPCRARARRCRAGAKKPLLPIPPESRPKARRLSKLQEPSFFGLKIFCPLRLRDETPRAAAGWREKPSQRNTRELLLPEAFFGWHLHRLVRLSGGAEDS